MNEMSERTHWDGCWRERTHHECAVARCEELERERDARALADAIYPTGAAPLGDAVRRIGEMKDERDAALARAEKAEKDAERFAWWFSFAPKPDWFVAQYLQGMREKFTLDQWRYTLDAARAKEPKA